MTVLQTSISSTVPDWEREKKSRGNYEPWKNFLATIRRYQQLKAGNSIAKKLLPLIVAKHRFWSAVCGIDIPLRTQLGGGLIMTHPNGIVIHPDALIGVNCLILQQVTIGVGPVEGTPIIGGHVDIGAGAKILGGIHIGNHVKIGANSVVLQDVPEWSTAVGIPAKIIRKAF